MSYTDDSRTLSLSTASSERELIVITKPEVGLRATPEGVTATTGQDITPLVNLLASETDGVADSVGDD